MLARAASCASRPAGSSSDLRGERWSVEGELAALAAELRDGRFVSPRIPDALARIWSALHCPTAGDVLLSAAPGYEFVDWGGADHVGGGSHGSLHATDSLGALCGAGPDPTRAPTREQWSLRDVAGMVRDHFVEPRIRNRLAVRGCLTRLRDPSRYIHAMPEELTTTVELPFRCARAPWRAPARTTGCSCSASPRLGPAATSSTWRCSRPACTCWRSTTGSRSSIAFVISVANNFWWNRHWTFDAKHDAPDLPGDALLRRLAAGTGLRVRGAGRAGRRSWAGEGRGPGDRGGGRHAAVVHRAEALELPRLRRGRRGSASAVSSVLTAPAAAAIAAADASADQPVLVTQQNKPPPASA